MLDQLIIGFSDAFTFINLLYIAGGITLGIIIGAIPGLGSVTALAVLIPVSYYMPPLSAIAILVGVNKPHPSFYVALTVSVICLIIGAVAWGYQIAVGTGICKDFEEVTKFCDSLRDSGLNF